MSDPAPDMLARIYDYLDDEMTPDERAAFEAELERDAELAEELASARAAMHVVSSAVSQVRAPDDFDRAVQRRIRRRSRGRYFSRPSAHTRSASLLFPLIALGVLVIIALLLGPGRIELLMDEAPAPAPGEPHPEERAPGDGPPGDRQRLPEDAEGGAQPAPPAARGRVAHPPSERPAEVMEVQRIEFRYTIRVPLDADVLRERLRARTARDSLEEVAPGEFLVHVRRGEHTEAVLRLSELGEVERERREVPWEERIPIRILARP